MRRALPIVGRLIVGFVLMITMATVHEEVHQGTCQQKQPGQERDDMGPMLGDQEIPTDHQETDQNYVGAGHKKAPLATRVICVIHVLTLYANVITRAFCD